MKYQFIMYTPEWKHKDRLIPRLLSFKKESFEIVISHASTIWTYMLLHSNMYNIILQNYQYVLLLGLVYTWSLPRMVLGLLEKHQSLKIPLPVTL